MRILETERLVLRPLKPGDLPTVLELAGDFRVARMLSDMPHPATPDNIAQWLTRGSGERRYAIDFNGTMIGSVGYFHQFWGRAELGYWLGAPWWGRGLAHEAAARLVGHAARYDGVRRFSASYFIDNPASGKVLVQLGFKSTERRRIYCPARQALVDAIACELVTETRSVAWLGWLPRLLRGARHAGGRPDIS
jgi:[ribosomal protein S5]-alanine N-acetyltransferase